MTRQLYSSIIIYCDTVVIKDIVQTLFSLYCIVYLKAYLDAIIVQKYQILTLLTLTIKWFYSSKLIATSDRPRRLVMTCVGYHNLNQRRGHSGCKKRNRQALGLGCLPTAMLARPMLQHRKFARGRGILLTQRFKFPAPRSCRLLFNHGACFYTFHHQITNLAFISDYNCVVKPRWKVFSP